MFPLIEITPPALSCAPLRYQVTLGVGIPDTTQVKVTRCFTSCSRSLDGDFVIPGGAVWNGKKEFCVMADYKLSFSTHLEP